MEDLVYTYVCVTFLSDKKQETEELQQNDIRETRTHSRAHANWFGFASLFSFKRGAKTKKSLHAKTRI